MISKFSGKLKSVLHIRILKSFILYFLKNHKVLFFMVSFFSNLGLKSLHCKYFVFSTTPLITKEQHFERKERCRKHGKKSCRHFSSAQFFISYLVASKPILGNCRPGIVIHVILISEDFLNRTRDYIKLGNFPSKISPKDFSSRSKSISHQFSWAFLP